MCVKVSEDLKRRQTSVTRITDNIQHLKVQAQNCMRLVGCVSSNMLISVDSLLPLSLEGCGSYLFI